MNVVPIELPALRERVEDIPHLVKHFIKLTSQKYKRQEPRLTEIDIHRMQNYDWPGNIRELQNIVERAVIFSIEERLHIDLPQSAKMRPASLTTNTPSARDSIITENERKRHHHENIATALAKANGKIYGPDGAATILGVKPTTLASRMKSLGIYKPKRD